MGCLMWEKIPHTAVISVFPTSVALQFSRAKWKRMCTGNQQYLKHLCKTPQTITLIVKCFFKESKALLLHLLLFVWYLLSKNSKCSSPTWWWWLKQFPSLFQVLCQWAFCRPAPCGGAARSLHRHTHQRLGQRGQHAICHHFRQGRDVGAASATCCRQPGRNCGLPGYCSMHWCLEYNLVKCEISCLHHMYFPQVFNNHIQPILYRYNIGRCNSC